MALIFFDKLFSLAKSITLIPLLPTLSSYAGPIPLLVVPILSVSFESSLIAENATLILPFHKELDGIREDSKDIDKIGTTRRGIGPAYEDKVGRRGITEENK